jgi:hypothetical protein
VFTLSGVSGVVRHANGDVVPGAHVSLYSETGESYYTSTDPQGAYSLVRRGAVALHAEGERRRVGSRGPRRRRSCRPSKRIS